jgi:L-threonylcarbamoyladenylate synthase
MKEKLAAPPRSGGGLPRWAPGLPIGPLRELFARGGLLAIPTESSYGLAADPRSAAGVAAIYRVKERERGKPLLVVAADLAQLEALGALTGAPGVAEIAALWPAPLTVLLPLREGQDLPAAAGGSTLAARIPAHADLRDFLARLGFALTATSANLAGAEPIVEPARLDELLAGEDAVVWDAGLLPGGPPSTLVEAGPDGLKVLRAGAFATGLLPGRQARGEAIPPR